MAVQASSLDRQLRALRFYRSTAPARFRPWVAPNGKSPQADFLRGAATHQKRVFRAGNRAGKTMVLAYDVITQLLGFHRYRRSKPGMRAWVSGLDRPWGIGEDLWPAFKLFLAQHEPGCFDLDCGCPLDPRLVTHARFWRGTKAGTQIPDTVMLRKWGGRVPQIIFKSADSGRRKYQGRGIDIFAINEEHPEDVYWEGRRGLITSGGQLICALTPIERMRWVQDLEAEEGTLVVRASVLDAARAGVAHLQTTEDILRYLPPRQRLLRELGDYAELEGAVYPAFAHATHVAQIQGHRLVLDGQVIAPWPLPSHWSRYAACDFGMGPGHATAILRATHDGERGRLIVDRCWYGEGTPAFRWAEWIRGDLTGLAAPVICDHDSQGRAAFEAMGVPTVPALKSHMRAGLDLVERLLEPIATDGLPKLVLVEDPTVVHPQTGRCDANKVWWEAERYRYPKTRTGVALRGDHPVKRDDHAMDALRYLVTYIVWQALQVTDGIGPFG